MALKELAIGIFDRKNPKQLSFNKETWSTTALYLSCLSDKYDTGGYKKVVVKIDNEFSDDDRLEDLADVWMVRAKLEIDSYFMQTKYARKKLLLDTLQNSLLFLAQKANWDATPLREAYNCCIQKDLEYIWLRKNKYVLSPNKANYASVLCIWDIDKFEAFVIFLDKQKKEVSKVKLFESEPHLVEPLGKMEWNVDSKQFVLYSKDGKHQWGAVLDKK